MHTPEKMRAQSLRSAEGKPLMRDFGTQNGDTASRDFGCAANLREIFLGGFRKYLVEFIGTMLFVYIGILSIDTKIDDSTMIPAFAHGIAIGVLIMGMGHVSGGHFNPAVTLSVALSKKMPWYDVLFYIVFQLFGGFIGALLARCSITEEKWAVIGGGLVTHGTEAYWFQVLICEMILTAILCTVVLNAESHDGLVPIGLAVGLTIFVDILAGANVSGPSLNPARTLGPSIVATIFSPSAHIRKTTGYMAAWVPWHYWYLYLIGPFLGSVIAALLFRILLARDDDRRWVQY